MCVKNQCDIRTFEALGRRSFMTSWLPLNLSVSMSVTSFSWSLLIRIYKFLHSNRNLEKEKSGRSGFSGKMLVCAKMGKMGSKWTQNLKYLKNVNVLTKANTIHKLTALLFVYYTKKIIDTT